MSPLPDDWDETAARYPEPIPLGVVDTAAFPVDVLPEWLRAHAQSVSDNTQTPIEAAAMRGLSVVSIATSGKGVVLVKHGFTEPTHTYSVDVQPSASRKSAVNTAMVQPITDWEAEREEETHRERQNTADTKKALEKRVDRLQKAMANADSPEGEGEARDALRRTRERLDALPPTSPPRLLADDITHEALPGLLLDNGGTMGMMGAEGTVFGLMRGRYSDGIPILELYNKSWSSEPVRVDRIGRPGEFVRHPCLTIGISTQPSVIYGVLKSPEMRGEGLLGRFMYTYPDDQIGHRLTGGAVPELDVAAANAYARGVRRLLDIPPAAVGTRGERIPHVMRLSPDAQSVFYDWWADVEAMLAPGAALSALPDWGGKLHGQTLRLAAQLHLAELVDESQPFGVQITANAMRGAVEIARFLIPHALKVFDELGEDEELALARYVWRRLDSDMTLRDLGRRTGGKAAIADQDALRAVVDTLKEHRMVFVDTIKDGQPGRPSEWIRRNPKALKSNAKNAKTPLKAV